jgi:uncharacterized protein
MATLKLERWKELLPDHLKWVTDRCILYHISGGRLYGTSEDTSDFDYIGVTIPPQKYVVGLSSFEQVELKQKVDGVLHEVTIYGIRKFMKLLTGCNPNIIESLFIKYRSRFQLATPAEYEHLWWGAIHTARKLFISQKAYHTFCGYASSQLHKLRVKKHNMTGRKELVEKFGFDTKFAMHAFRLYQEGIQLLKSGELEFPLSNLQELKDIRNGLKYTEFQLDKCIEDLEKWSVSMGEALATTKLPHDPDRDSISNLMIYIFSEMREIDS